MEEPTLNNSATPAKCALLARLHNNHVHKFVVRTEDKLREHFAGAIEAARARGLAPVFDFEPGDDDDELIEPAPAPAAPPFPTDGLKTPAQAARLSTPG